MKGQLSFLIFQFQTRKRENQKQSGTTGRIQSETVSWINWNWNNCILYIVAFRETKQARFLEENIKDWCTLENRRNRRTRRWLKKGGLSRTWRNAPELAYGNMLVALLHGFPITTFSDFCSHCAAQFTHHKWSVRFSPSRCRMTKKSWLQRLYIELLFRYHKIMQIIRWFPPSHRGGNRLIVSVPEAFRSFSINFPSASPRTCLPFNQSLQNTPIVAIIFYYVCVSCASRAPSRFRQVSQRSSPLFDDVIIYLPRSAW